MDVTNVPVADHSVIQTLNRSQSLFEPSIQIHPRMLFLLVCKDGEATDLHATILPWMFQADP